MPALHELAGARAQPEHEPPADSRSHGAGRCCAPGHSASGKGVRACPPAVGWEGEKLLLGLGNTFAGPDDEAVERENTEPGPHVRRVSWRVCCIGRWQDRKDLTRTVGLGR